MLKRKINIRKYRYEIFLYAAFVLINSIPCFFLTVPVFSDGLNTIAVSAYMSGSDWHRYLYADGYYYKYGMTVLYLPLFYLFCSPVVLYRAMLLLNVLAAGAVPVIAYKIAVDYLNIRKKENALLIAGVTAFLPALTLNIKYTWAETVLLVSPWMILLLLLRIHEDGDAGKQVRDSILIACSSVFAYMAHQRGIVVVLATFLTVIYIRFVRKKANLRIGFYLVTAMVLLIADRFMDRLVKQYVFNADVNTANSTFSLWDANMWDRLLSFTGLQTIIKIIYGWLFNVFTGSGGLVCLGLCVILVCFFRYGSGEKRYYIHLISVFSLLCFVGAFALGGIFFFSDIYLYYTGEMVRRCDKLIYGRYLESSILIPVFMGMYFLLEKGFLFIKRRRYIFLIMVSVYLFFLVNIAGRINGVVTWPHTTMTINIFSNLAQCRHGYSAIRNLAQGLAAYGALAVVILVSILIFHKKQRMVCTGVIAVFISIFVWSSYNVIYRMDKYEMENMEMTRNLVKGLEQLPEDYKVIFLDDEITRSSYQYMFRDYYIVTGRDDNRTHIKDMIIVSPKGLVNRELDQGDYFELVDMETESPDYHLYIKGRGMNQWMNQNGIQTKQLSCFWNRRPEGVYGSRP